MRYMSTRGQDGGRDFTDVLLAGLAGDGGLFMPESWPQLSPEEIRSFAGCEYAEVAARIVQPFIGDAIPEAQVRKMCLAAYSRFSHPAVAPLTQIGPEEWVLELFRGPTLAFKDFAMLLLGQLFEFALQERGERLTIVGATSGDTGSAAIEALRGLDTVAVFILHPEGRVSETQRRMMTSVKEENINNIAVQGTFDDCQALIKAMFADDDFRRNIKMGAINSINWARIMAQAVYYFTSAVALGAPDRSISYIVPTGNFGDIFAGHVASQMGLSVQTLCIATNRNDILRRTLEDGVYAPLETHKTISPSMDIQVSSNFERLIFEATGRDFAAVSDLMDDLKKSGQFSLSDNILAIIREKFLAFTADEAETTAKLSEVHQETGTLIDPHTSVGLVASEKARQSACVAGPVVTLATAHPAKFPDAVRDATGATPDLPSGLADLFSRKENYSVLPNDLRIIQKHILKHI